MYNLPMNREAGENVFLFQELFTLNGKNLPKAETKKMENDKSNNKSHRLTCEENIKHT